MPQICCYFELHQPYRLTDYTVFDVSRNHDYFATQSLDENKHVFQKVAQKSYIPMLSLLLELVKSRKEFVFSISCSGIFLEQAERYEPRVLTLLQALVQSGQVEVLAETYYHSLSSLYSKSEFYAQIDAHKKKVKKLFHVTPRIFRNTELIYSDLIGSLVAEKGFAGMLTEAVDRYLDGQKRTQLFSSYTAKRIPLLLKHAQLSDDIAFRFSDRNWVSYPLHADTYVHWLNSYAQEEIINLFMDFETFGEHQWSDTGIFEFFQHVVFKVLESKWNRFVTPSQAIKHVDVNTLPFYKVPDPISWADVDRDLSAWRDNDLQHDALRLVYELEEKIVNSRNKALLEDWRKLQTSDHFYYMCIKWSADGDVHSYFSPYQNPMDAYVRFTTVFADIASRLFDLEQINNKKKTTKKSDKKLQTSLAVKI